MSVFVVCFNNSYTLLTKSNNMRPTSLAVNARASPSYPRSIFAAKNKPVTIQEENRFAFHGCRVSDRT